MQTFNIFLLMAMTTFGLYQGNISYGEQLTVLILGNIALILIGENERRKKRDKVADDLRSAATTPSKLLLHD